MTIYVPFLFLFLANFVKNIWSLDSKIIPMHLFNVMGEYDLEIGFGKEPFIIFMTIDLQMQTSWVSPQFYSLNRSTTVKKISLVGEKIKVENNYEPVFILEDIIKIARDSFTGWTSFNKPEKYEITGYTFYYLPNITYTSKQYISFSYKPLNDNENYSLLHLLYNNKIIEKKQFSFVQEKNSYFTIFLGGIILKEEEKYSVKCKIIHNSWGCNYSYLYISNNKSKIYKSDQIKYIYFQATSNKISIPISLYDFFSEELFPPYFQNDTCKEEIIGNFRSINCKCEGITYLPNIVLVIEGKKFYLDKDMLFFNPIGLCVFVMKVNKDEEKENSIILGTTFYDKYNTLFDYDNAEISFFSDKPFEIIEYTINSVLYKNICLFFICIIGTWVGILCIIKKFLI